MKANVRLGVVLALALTVLLASPAWAKSPPDTLVLEGPGLSTPVMITDPAALARFSPWDQAFLDLEGGEVAAPPPGAPRYTVSFFLGGRKIYVLAYVPGPAGGPGFIHIPGPDDPDFRLDIGTIMASNGTWHHATAAWDVAMQGILLRKAALSPGAASTRPSVAAAAVPLTPIARLLLDRPPVTPQPGPSLWAGTLAAIGLLGGSALMVRRRRQHRAG